jgi:transcription initiation factor IIF auxiliary subunit
MTEQEQIAKTQRYIMEEIEAFAAVGHHPVSEDDLRYIVYLRGETDENQALMNLIRRGEVTVELNPDDIAESLLMATEAK